MLSWLQPFFLSWILAVGSVAQGSSVLELTPTTDSVGRFGAHVANAGDVTGDGVADAAVTCQEGATLYCLYSGRTGRLVHVVEWPTGELGEGQASIGLVNALAVLGDVSGDGIPDFAVGVALFGQTNHYDRPDAGRFYVIDGLSAELIYTVVSPDPIPYAYFASAVVGVGDVNGNKTPDLAVGAMGEGDGRGRVYIFDGGHGELLRVLEGPSGTDPSIGARFGQAIANFGDLNGDGVNDIGVGAENDLGGRGTVSVFSGLTGEQLYRVPSPMGQPGGYKGFGFSLSGAGDINLDGTLDFTVGEFRNGRAYVFSGENGSLLMQLDPPPNVFHGSFGYAVDNAHNVDADGIPDFVVSAPRVGTNRGITYILSGRTGKVIESIEPPLGSSLWFGQSISTAAPLGSSRWIMVAAPRQAGYEGRAYLYKFGEDPVVSIAVGAVFPNPTTGRLTVPLSGSGPGIYQLDVIDMLGRTAMTSAVSVSESGRVWAPLDLGDLSAGVYHVVLRAGDSIISRKVAVVH